jgi:hypothetical protein
MPNLPETSGCVRVKCQGIKSIGNPKLKHKIVQVSVNYCKIKQIAATHHARPNSGLSTSLIRIFSHVLFVHESAGIQWYPVSGGTLF